MYLVDDETKKNFINGAVKATGALVATQVAKYAYVAGKYVYDSNILGSMLFGILCCGYCRKTPKQKREALKKQYEREKLTRQQESQQYSYLNHYLFYPKDVRERRKKAAKQLQEEKQKLKKYEEQEYPEIKKKMSIYW